MIAQTHRQLNEGRENYQSRGSGPLKNCCIKFLTSLIRDVLRYVILIEFTPEKAIVAKDPSNECRFVDDDVSEKFCWFLKQIHNSVRMQQ